MKQREYADFDLAIEDLGDGRFRARVIDSPAGQATTEFEMPFSDLELENFLLRIGRPRAGTRRLESPETEAARRFGGKLYDSVFGDDVARQWERSIDAAERENRGLRLRLRLSEAPQLADLPWEYLWSPASDDFVVLSSWTPVVRYISLDKGAPPLTVAPPLKMLVMISSPTDVPSLDVEAEWARLDEAMSDIVDAGLVEIHRLENATLRELQRALRRDDFHLFHFIGHGGYDVAADDGVLLLETEEGRAREVSGRQLGTILDDARTVRVAVLNACEGARASGEDPFAGVAQSLVARGIPAVVAMQFEITDRAAIVFAHEFYAAITDGLAVEGAVGEARRAIFGAKPDVEWGTAVLYMRAEDGRLFDLQALRKATLEMERLEVPTAEVPVAVEPGVAESAEATEPEAEPELTVAEPVAVEPDVVELADVTELEAEPESEVAEPVVVEPETAESVPEEVVETTPPWVVDDEPTVVTDKPPVFDGTDEPGGPTAPSFRERYPAAPKWAAGIVGVLAALGLIGALAGNPDDVTAPSAAGGGGDVTATTVAGGGVDVETLDSREVVSPAAPEVTVDGEIDEWLTSPINFDIKHPVANDLRVQRLGEDPDAALWLGHDNDALYVFVSVADDVYSQPNTGSQIWRGDAFDINLVVGSDIPQRPDERTFQLTMTPRSDVSGAPEVVRFTGNGQAFSGTTTTTDLDVELAGTVRQQIGWTLEARIPWSTFGLSEPPASFDAALFAVFDNDGEMDGERSAQAEILTNMPSAFFQEPLTWGSLITE